MRAIFVLACVVALLAPVAQASSATALTITYIEDSARPAERLRWTLRCDPLGGTHPRRATVCRELDRLGWRAFQPTPRETACAEIYGGPQVAIVSGRVDGRWAWVRLSRIDGCEIERWGRVRGLLFARRRHLEAHMSGVDSAPVPGRTEEATVSADANKALVRRFYEEVWDRGNTDFAFEVFADDYVRHDFRPTTTVPGPAGQKAIADDFRAAFPDLRVVVDLIFGEGDFVVGRWTATGTHLGAWGAVEPTGRPVTFSAANLYRFENGKVAEIWNHRDDLGLREQLGVAIYAGARPDS